MQASGLASLGVVAEVIDAPSMFDLMVPLTLFGYGQGFVMAQLFSTVLRSVAHVSIATTPSEPTRNPVLFSHQVPSGWM